jgi:hypothetical protein
MSDPDPTLAPSSSPAAGAWARCRVTLGPVLVGVLGGVLAGGLSVAAAWAVLRSAASTYARFPGVERPWMAADVPLPGGVALTLGLLGTAGLLLMGLVTALVARPRDRWEDVSAGLGTGLAATLAGYFCGIGWMAATAAVIVPSIADMTLLGTAARPAAEGRSADPLVQRYPDLAGIEPADRGPLVAAKVCSDQVVGCATGAWLGGVLALGTCGVFGFVGTLAGGFAVRRGGRARVVLASFCELAWSCGGALCLLLVGLGVGGEFHWLPWLGVVGVTVLIVLAVTRRWRWPLRLTLAAAWLTTAAYVQGTPWWSVGVAAVVAYAALVVLLAQQRLLAARPAVAVA